MDEDTAKAEGGLTGGNRHLLTVLPAGSRSVAEGEIAADPIDVPERCRPVTAQGERAEGGGQTAVLDSKAGPCPELEISGAGVHPASCQTADEDAGAGAAEDLLRLVRTGGQKGVGHPRQRG